MWAGVAFAGHAVAGAWVEPRALVAAAAFCAVAGAVAVRGAAGGWRLAAVTACAGAVGIAVGASCFGAVLAEGATLNGASGESRAVVVADPRVDNDTVRLRLRVVDGVAAGHVICPQWRLADAPQRGDARLPRLGEIVVVRGRLEVASKPELRAYDLLSGTVARGSVWSLQRAGWRPGALGVVARLRAGAQERLAAVSGDGAAVLSGILLGDRERLRDTQAEMDMRAAGLAHVLAVSGTHLAIVLACAAAVGKAARASRRAVLTSGLVLGLSYVLLSGAQISAVRAFGVALVACAAGFSGRRGDALASLAAVVCVALVLDPTTAFSVGFALSVTACGGLVLLAPLASAWISVGLPQAAQRLGGPLAATLVATGVTAPIVASVFGTVPVVGPVANLLCVPLVSLSLATGLAGLALGALAPPLGVLALRAAAQTLDVVCSLAGWLGSRPGASLPVGGGPVLVLGIVAGLTTAWALWPLPRTSRRARGVLLGFVALVSVVLVPAAPGDASIIFLDVGQGDAVLVSDNGHSLLIDTGPDPLVLRRALARCDLRRLDAAVITHGHDDHYGGLEALVGIVPKDRVFCSAVMDMPSGQPLLDPARSLSQGDQVRVGDFVLDVIWPAASHRPADENEASVVMHARLGEVDVLLTGDAEEPVYDRCRAQGLLGAVEIAKSPHHGSSDGFSENTLGALRPQLAVISVGLGNRFGHPAPSTLADYGHAGIRVLRTDTSGDVKIEVAEDGSGYTVHADRSDGASGAETRRGDWQSRGTRLAAYATIRHADVCGAERLKTETRSRGRPVRPQARIPDPRTRGAAARACSRAPP